MFVVLFVNVIVLFDALEGIFRRTVRPCLRKLFGFIFIFNDKFILDLGMARIQRGFRILESIWDVFVISILNMFSNDFRWGLVLRRDE